MSNVRLELYHRGVERATVFLKQNRLPAVQRYYDRYCGGTGCYLPRRLAVVVDVATTALPVQRPYHMRWSYPGYKTDRTAIGVVAHEVGHHVDYVRSAAGDFDRSAWRAAISAVRRRVSSYEPNDAEAFAESMRLFILNPTLLACGLPARYRFIERELRLTPIEERAWDRVLPAAFHDAVRRWIA